MLFRFAGVLAAILLSTAASAEDFTGVAFAGGAAGDGLSGYAGVVHALPGSALGKGLAVRGSVSGGSYEYDSGSVPTDGRFAAVAGCARVHAR